MSIRTVLRLAGPHRAHPPDSSAPRPRWDSPWCCGLRRCATELAFRHGAASPALGGREQALSGRVRRSAAGDHAWASVREAADGSAGWVVAALALGRDEGALSLLVAPGLVDEVRRADGVAVGPFARVTAVAGP